MSEKLMDLARAYLAAKDEHRASKFEEALVAELEKYPDDALVTGGKVFLLVPGGATECGEPVLHVRKVRMF